MTRSPRASARGFLLWGFRLGLSSHVAERVAGIKAPGGSRGTPGATTTQRAMPIREEPTNPVSPLWPCIDRAGCGRIRFAAEVAVRMRLMPTEVLPWLPRFLRVLLPISAVGATG